MPTYRLISGIQAIGDMAKEALSRDLLDRAAAKRKEQAEDFAKTKFQGVGPGGKPLSQADSLQAAQRLQSVQNRLERQVHNFTHGHKHFLTPEKAQEVLRSSSNPVISGSNVASADKTRRFTEAVRDAAEKGKGRIRITQGRRRGVRGGGMGGLLAKAGRYALYGLGAAGAAGTAGVLGYGLYRKRQADAAAQNAAWNTPPAGNNPVGGGFDNYPR